jgi:hypothetical protein
MATVLEECASEEQRSVVHFLWAKELNTKGIHTEMFPVYERFTTGPRNSLKMFEGLR